MNPPLGSKKCYRILSRFQTKALYLSTKENLLVAKWLMIHHVEKQDVNYWSLKMDGNVSLCSLE